MILSKNNDSKWLRIKKLDNILTICDFRNLFFYSCEKKNFIVAKKFFYSCENFFYSYEKSFFIVVKNFFKKVPQ